MYGLKVWICVPINLITSMKTLALEQERFKIERKINE